MKQAIVRGLCLVVLAVLVALAAAPAPVRAEGDPQHVVIDITYLIERDQTKDPVGDFELSGTYVDSGRSTQTSFEEHLDGTYTSVHELRSRHGTIVVMVDVGPFPRVGTFMVLSGTRAYEGLEAEGETIVDGGGNIWDPDHHFLYFHLDSDPPPNVPPTVGLGAAPVPSSPYTYRLTAAYNDADGYPTLFEWDFTGDGVWNAETDQSWTTHTYPGVGTYHPVVRVTDDDGASATATREIVVSPAPTVAITNPAYGSELSGIVTLAASVTNAYLLRFHLDGMAGTDLGSTPGSALSPWTGAIAWDTTTAANGEHTLVAAAFSPDGFYATASIQMTVANVHAYASPSIATIVPDTIAAGWTILVTVTGDSLQPGAALSFASGSGLTPVASEVFVVGPTQLTALVTVAKNGPPGTQTWDVVVTNPDGRTAVLTQALTVVK